MFKTKELRYVLAGIWNKLFGYFTSLLIYDSFHVFLHILFIGLIANILNISMSFLTYKVFVFRTKNHWLKEYLGSYIIYGGVALISLCILWLAVDYLKMPFWIAQALVMSLGVIISYIGHDRFTFKVN
jgi:putative flippase GtrA